MYNDKNMLKIEEDKCGFLEAGISDFNIRHKMIQSIFYMIE